MYSPSLECAAAVRSQVIPPAGFSLVECSPQTEFKLAPKCGAAEAVHGKVASLFLFPSVTLAASVRLSCDVRKLPRVVSPEAWVLDQ